MIKNKCERDQMITMIIQLRHQIKQLGKQIRKEKNERKRQKLIKELKFLK